MSRLTRDGTAKSVSPDQILRHERGQKNIHFPCSANHEQDWQPCPVDSSLAICDDHTPACSVLPDQRINMHLLFLYYCVCVCCMCCHPIYSVHQACARTNRGHTGGRPLRISHPPSFCGAYLNFYCEKDSAVLFLINLKVEFCVPTN